MWYELWNLTSGNLMHDFERAAEAMATVRDYLAEGAVSPEALGLVVYDNTGRPTRSITGRELAAFVSGADIQRR